MGLLNGILHVVVGDGIMAPAVLGHEVVAETAFMDNDAVVGQILQILDFHRVNLLVQHAMCENLDNGLAIVSIFVVERGIHAANQVGMTVLQVFEDLLCRLQLDDIWDIEFLAQHLEQVDVVAHGFAVLIKEGVGPQVPCIFIYQRTLFRKCPYAVVPLLCKGRQWQEDE